MFLRRVLLSAFLLLSSAFTAAAELSLVMVEEAGCVWCARWNDEIAHIYPKTPEGQSAPLRRIDIHAALPDDLTFARRLSFTPTFVLMQDNLEISRIEGYPGEDFFWGLLEKMLEKADSPPLN
ncbi:hypothetical protein JQV27_16455 [Sulfitobacter mediterraneus]|jgi:hypothetical protein|uniref:hypothetical protein n=1 Tax=Sulfitobacter mediterraneus TaxID=83219 RepID=UPI00193358D7|nr:hypothetical protein [Sulfitobacter mediterraneus]MBM1634444.1 hypothetical protein [Sulfitobacter mediterraneus]MBM1642261.1 hypothetical protein [Sulfitobacter mediterraneus]MBM1646310.1 hypothetical protein [Sulfitobacter mediterraneus]MBM1650356.1 hypothetical protein [Sulfitobacter mediterraneus]MBM1654378.1 hypothetical protein [Sulfitobacter mediterraneus]